MDQQERSQVGRAHPSEDWEVGPNPLKYYADNISMPPTAPAAPSIPITDATRPRGVVSDASV